MSESSSKPVPIPRASDSQYWPAVKPEQVMDRELASVLNVYFARIFIYRVIDHRHRYHDPAGLYRRTFACNRSMFLKAAGPGPGVTAFL